MTQSVVLLVFLVANSDSGSRVEQLKFPMLGVPLQQCEILAKAVIATYRNATATCQRQD